MRVSLVVAAARNGVIGCEGEIPWRLPDDQRFFRALTTGHCIVMGRKTFESIGRALPNRTNVVLSRGDASAIRGETQGVQTASGLAEAEAWARGEGFPELFVIGGEALYRDALVHADRIYLTRVDAEPEGDVFFPVIEAAELEALGFRCTGRDPHSSDARHAHSFTIETWQRDD